MERNQTLGGMAASLTQSPISMPLNPVHTIEGNLNVVAHRFREPSSLQDWCVSAGDAKFPELENHPDDQNENIGRQVPTSILAHGRQKVQNTQVEYTARQGIAATSCDHQRPEPKAARRNL